MKFLRLQLVPDVASSLATAQWKAHASHLRLFFQYRMEDASEDIIAAGLAKLLHMLRCCLDVFIYCWNISKFLKCFLDRQFWLIIRRFTVDCFFQICANSFECHWNPWDCEHVTRSTVPNIFTVWKRVVNNKQQNIPLPKANLDPIK